MKKSMKFGNSYLHLGLLAMLDRLQRAKRSEGVEFARCLRMGSTSGTIGHPAAVAARPLALRRDPFIFSWL